MADSTFNAFSCDGVEKGFCVVLEEGQIVYAGPLHKTNGNFLEGKEIVMNPADYELLKNHVIKSRH